MKKLKRPKMKSIHEGKLGDLIRQTEKNWKEARIERQDERAIAMGIAQDGPDWIMAFKLPSGRSFSCQTREYKALLFFLVGCGERLVEEYDFFALEQLIKQFALNSGDEEILNFVEEHFGLDIVGNPFEGSVN
jgi:hypothetical protein